MKRKLIYLLFVQKLTGMSMEKQKHYILFELRKEKSIKNTLGNC